MAADAYLVTGTPGTMPPAPPTTTAPAAHTAVQVRPGAGLAVTGFDPLLLVAIALACFGLWAIGRGVLLLARRRTDRRVRRGQALLAAGWMRWTGGWRP